MNEFPRDAKGEVLFRGTSPGDFKSYVAWLANYLYTVNLEPSARQLALCDGLRTMSDKEWAMQVIGMNAALYDSMIAEIDIAILDVPGSLYRNAPEDIDSALAILKEREREDAESAPGGNEGPVIISCNTITSGHAREDVEARIAEMREAKLLVGELADDFCDVGWRLPLAVVLRDVPQKEERIRLLTLFFDYFCEYIAK